MRAGKASSRDLGRAFPELAGQVQQAPLLRQPAPAEQDDLLRTRLKTCAKPRVERIHLGAPWALGTLHLGGAWHDIALHAVSLCAPLQERKQEQRECKEAGCELVCQDEGDQASIENGGQP